MCGTNKPMQHSNQTEPEIPEKNLSVSNWPLPSPLTWGLVRGDEGIRPVQDRWLPFGLGMISAKLSRPGCAGLLRSRLQSGCSQTHQDGYDREALGGDPGAHHELGTLALTPVEAIEAVGKGGRRAQAA